MIRIATAHSVEEAAAAAADVVEVRLDAHWPTPPSEEQATETLLAYLDTGKTLLATLRPQRQGGAYDGPEDVRLGLLVAAAKAGFAYVDLEGDLQQPAPVLRALEDAGAKVIVSDHTLPTVPARDVGLQHLVRLQDHRQAIDKIALPAGSFADALRALELAHAHAARGGHPCVMPHGFGDPQLRALLALAGNVATYGHAGTPAVPGQPALADIQATWDHWGLDVKNLPAAGHRPWFAVLGRPVGHSLSPRIHNAALATADRPERFGALDVPDSAGAFRLVLTIAARIGLAGASVTHPHKHHALLATTPDATAKAVGAVNCVRMRGGTPEGTNTDATAAKRLLANASSVVVLGAGGAARAVLHAARELGIPATFTSRDEERARAVEGDLGATWVPWDQRHTIEADAWVQATPAAVDATLQGATLAIELNYAAESPFALAARQAGIPCVDGKQFLVEQAVDAYRFWTGNEPSRASMEAALEDAP